MLLQTLGASHICWSVLDGSGSWFVAADYWVEAGEDVVEDVLIVLGVEIW